MPLHCSANNRSTSRSNASAVNGSVMNLGGYNGWIYHCSIKFHKLEVLEMSYDKLLSHSSDNLEHDILDGVVSQYDILDIYLHYGVVSQLNINQKLKLFHLHLMIVYLIILLKKKKEQRVIV